MGAHSTKRSHGPNDEGDSNDVTFDDFTIVRAIGKGSFGKVCIVQKKANKCNYAMKYMNKAKCLERDAFKNVMREIELLAELNHPFLVNLWYTFQDVEDMFMVCDLLLGGDLRYHLNQEIRFAEDRVKLYTCEAALAIDYLQRKRILHRDIKPDNILLDDHGHVHVTDFNVATVIDEHTLATSLTGTRPYMAPEIFGSNLRQCLGYSFPVDWWSLGICVYEMLRGRRPYDLHIQMNSHQAYDLLMRTPLAIPVDWSDDLIGFVDSLLSVKVEQRVMSLESFKAQTYMSRIRFEDVLRRKTAPVFIPPTDTLNCDPTFELEEMIIESKPLHKKKKRLAKGGSAGDVVTNEKLEVVPEATQALAQMNNEFKKYNREELLRDEEERVKKLEEELGIRPPPDKDAIGRRLGR